MCACVGGDSRWADFPICGIHMVHVAFPSLVSTPCWPFNFVKSRGLSGMYIGMHVHGYVDTKNQKNVEADGIRGGWCAWSSGEDGPNGFMYASACASWSGFLVAVTSIPLDASYLSCAH